MLVLRTITAARYVTPLREGGSLPAIVEGDDGDLYVLKFRGAGQGHRALIAELLAGEIGRALGLRVPEIVFIQVEPEFGRSEPNPEIHDLIAASIGLNIGLRFLQGSFAFDPLTSSVPPVDLASAIVWFDAFVTNVDRTARNTNMLVWRDALWLIDHGAALYFHHAWDGYVERSQSRFPQVKDHVLLPYAGNLAGADTTLHTLLSEELLQRIVDAVPAEWLGDEPALGAVADDHRRAYMDFLRQRLRSPRGFVEEAIDARRGLV